MTNEILELDALMDFQNFIKSFYRVDPAIILPIRINKPVAITNPANQWAAILTDTIPEMSRDRKPWILSDNDLVILMVQPIM